MGVGGREEREGGGGDGSRAFLCFFRRRRKEMGRRMLDALFCVMIPVNIFETLEIA